MYNDIDKKLKKYFEEQKEFICCKEGCSACCELGEYPFSRPEAMYLLDGFLKLPLNIRAIVKSNIEKLREDKKNFQGDRFEYKCPFLIDKKCCVYDYRGITCRVHGLAFKKKDNSVCVPYCSTFGLNYSTVFKDGIFSAEPVNECLTIDELFTNQEEIRPLIGWFN